MNKQEVDGKSKYEISIIVCSYNPRIEALFFTLDSIIKQKNINMEIIITDDGSKNNLFIEIERYFEIKKFSEWKMICNKNNQGTVQNLYSGLLAASGKYVKTISPGDALCKEDTLRNWIDFNINKKYLWSFSNALYYIGSHNNYNIISVNAHPNNIQPYIKQDNFMCRWHYVGLSDVALGAAILSEKNIQVEYIEQIVGKVIYAEDNIWRMMMFDGVIGGYYSQNTILYEYGTGISTSGETIWNQRIRQDHISANKIMLNKSVLSEFQKEVIEAWKLENGNILQKILIKEKLKEYIKKKIRHRKTDRVI